jgi:hypothetical protein
VASPIPLLAPVTRATVPDKFCVMHPPGVGDARSGAALPV